MISVIVPVYNAEKYLHRCINSILAQTFVDIELLLIDDGSTDSSSVICDKYAKKDQRVRVFHKENGGVSSARNLGLDNAQGEWIAIVDVDEWVKETYLSNLLSHVREDIDLVFSYAEIHCLDGSVWKENYPTTVVSDDITSLFLNNDLSWHTSPWSKLYRYSLCKGLRFVENMHIGEDMVFLYSYMLKCKSIFVSSDTDYIYNYENPGTLTKRINSVESELLSYKKISEIVSQVINQKKITNSDALSRIDLIKASYIKRVLSSLYYQPNMTYKERIQIIMDLDTNHNLHHISTTSAREKLYLFLLEHKCFAIYDFIRKIAAWYHYTF